MGTGLVPLLAGVALLAGSPVVAASAGLLWLTYHAVVVGVEEPNLQGAFGPEYDRYCGEVPRWLPGRTAR